MNKPWYQRPGWIIALLVLFFPAGLFLMWRYSAWELRTKRLVTGLLVWPVGALFLTRHTAWPRWTKGLAWGAAAIWVIFALAFAVAPFSNGATDDGNLVQSATSEEPSEDSTGQQTVEVATEMENAEEPKTAPTSEPTIEVTPNPQPVVTPAATPTPLATTTPEPSATPELGPAGETAEVVEVVDGDTIKVRINGRIFSIRYIGMDTPETRHPTVGLECFGREASDANQRLVGGETVTLERDVSDADRFNRLLRYIWLDGEMINERLVRDGYAVSSTYQPDVRHQETLRLAEREAREANRGLWAGCGDADTLVAPAPSTVAPSAPAPAPAPGPAPAPAPAPVPAPAPADNGCLPEYPDFCIPAGPDLDCPDIGRTDFTVLAPDSMRFDADNDGVGCES